MQQQAQIIQIIFTRNNRFPLVFTVFNYFHRFRVDGVREEFVNDQQHPGLDVKKRLGYTELIYRITI